MGKGIERGRGGGVFDTPNEPRLVRMTLRWREGREYFVYARAVQDDKIFLPFF